MGYSVTASQNKWIYNHSGDSSGTYKKKQKLEKLSLTSMTPISSGYSIFLQTIF